MIINIKDKQKCRQAIDLFKTAVTETDGWTQIEGYLYRKMDSKLGRSIYISFWDYGSLMFTQSAICLNAEYCFNINRKQYKEVKQFIKEIQNKKDEIKLKELDNIL